MYIFNSMYIEYYYISIMFSIKFADKLIAKPNWGFTRFTPKTSARALSNSFIKPNFTRFTTKTSARTLTDSFNTRKIDDIERK